MRSALAEAYSRTGPAWQAGPGVVYDRLADAAIDRCPVDLSGASVLDLGAGTGAATRAAQRRGALVTAVDVAFGMLATRAETRPPAVVGDALSLPFRERAFDAVIAAFSLNHVVDPARAMRDAARVLRPGGALIATAYAEDDTHPVKSAVDGAARARGWVEEQWCVQLRTETVPRLATAERAAAVMRDAELAGGHVEHTVIALPDLTREQLVRWRAGMANLAPFVGRLTATERAAFMADALERLGDDAPTLQRSVIVMIYVEPSSRSASLRAAASSGA